MLTEAEIQRLIDKIVAYMEPEKVIVFGSYAKGTATYRSDLDLLVVKETELSMQQRSAVVHSFLTTLLIKVDVHVYTPEEIEEFGNEPFSFVQSILKTGKVLYQR